MSSAQAWAHRRSDMVARSSRPWRVNSLSASHSMPSRRDWRSARSKPAEVWRRASSSSSGRVQRSAAAWTAMRSRGGASVGQGADLGADHVFEGEGRAQGRLDRGAPQGLLEDVEGAFLGRGRVGDAEAGGEGIGLHLLQQPASLRQACPDRGGDLIHGGRVLRRHLQVPAGRSSLGQAVCPYRVVAGQGQGVGGADGQDVGEEVVDRIRLGEAEVEAVHVVACGVVRGVGCGVACGVVVAGEGGAMGGLSRPRPPSPGQCGRRPTRLPGKPGRRGLGAMHEAPVTPGEFTGARRRWGQPEKGTASAGFACQLVAMGWSTVTMRGRRRVTKLSSSPATERWIASNCLPLLLFVVLGLMPA